MIITQTPFRMSFFGGGTDMESFFRENGGAVLSTTFDKYCYVNVRHLPRFFNYSTELSYAKTERVTCVEDIQHPAIRNAMKMLDWRDITSGNHGKGSSTAMNRIVFCLHNCFMRNMNYTHAVWEGRNGCVNLFTCCEMKQCLKNNARTHKKSIKIWGIYENTIDNFPILCYI